jgi:hypothetical protein
MDNYNIKPKLKNVKIAEHVHTQIKKVAIETGINLGHLIEMGAMKIVQDYENGTFDPIKKEYSKIRRDGSFVRS